MIRKILKTKKKQTGVMRMRSLEMSLIAGIAGLFITSTPVMAANFMSADAVKKLVSGKTANGVHLTKGHKYKIYFNSNGSYVQARVNGSRFVGHWRVKRNGKHCIKPSHKNREFCRGVRANKDGTFTKVKERSFKNNKDVVKWSNFVDGDKTK